MGLFSMFRSQVEPDVTPRQSLVISMIYAIAADGEIAREEIGHLHSILGHGIEHELEFALKYVRAIKPSQFLEVNARNLTRQQQLCIILNMIDSVMSDGHAAPEEQALIKQYQQGFGLDDATLEPYFTTLVVKNDRSVLDGPGGGSQGSGPALGKR